MARHALIRFGAVGFLALLVLVAIGWLTLEQVDRRRNDMPIPGLDAPRIVVVPPGSSLGGVAARLADEGLLRHPESWVRLARRERLAGRLRAGEFEVLPGTTPRQLLEQVVAGRVLLHSLTLPEGWTVRQALEALRQHEAIEVTPVTADESALAQALGVGDRPLEGMLFPDTYLFPRGTKDVEVLRQAHQRLAQELEAAWAARAEDIPIDSPYEALILASIVEKETGVRDERPRIAGVFANRLRLGMRLQTDPTVIYGLGPAFDGNLRRRDLERDTPYNTYTRFGLPPTPIALAGREAMRAAVAPAETEALYFVATGLGDGRHRFARSLAEHNDNVARYIAALRGAAKEGPP